MESSVLLNTGRLLSMALSDFFRSADGLSIAVVLLQGLLFLAGGILFLARSIRRLAERRGEAEAVSAFWGASSLTDAIDILSKKPSMRWHNQLIGQGIQAANWYRKQEVQAMTVMFPMPEWIARTLRVAFCDAKRALSRGVRFLRMSAPLMVMLGLFGTIWQTMVALMVVSERDLSMDLAVAMTPLLFGLAAATLLWVAYGLLNSLCRDIAGRLENFMIDLCSYLVIELDRE